MFQHAMEFWVSEGLDGFSLRDVNLLFEVNDILLNEPINELHDKQVNYT